MIAAAARVYIRIHHLKRINADDYLFFIAVAAFIPGAALFFAYIGVSYDAIAISNGESLPPPSFTQEIESLATYALLAELLCWAAIYSVKFSFLLYFRALIN